MASSQDWNNVFVQAEKKTFYVPVYLRVMVKKIKQIDFIYLESQMNVTIILNTHTYGLPQQIRRHISENIEIQLNRNQTQKLNTKKGYQAYIIKSDLLLKKFKNLDQSQKQKLKQKGEIQIGDKFTLRRSLKVAIDPYVIFTPIQLVDTVLSVKLRSIKYKDYTIDFNLLSKQTQQRYNMQTVRGPLDYSLSASKIGDSYCLANTKLAVQYTNQMVHSTLMSIGKNIYNVNFLDVKRQNSNQIDHQNSFSSCFAHFHVPIYKNFVSAIKFLFTIFAPLFILSFLTHGIFAQSSQLDQRIGAIATILIAFIAMVPAIRATIPPNQYITAAEILIYFQTLVQVLCLAQSLSVNQNHQHREEVNQFITTQQLMTGPLYLTSYCIMWIGTILQLILIGLAGYVAKTCHSDKLQKSNLKNDKNFLQWKFFSFVHSPNQHLDIETFVKRFYFYGSEDYNKFINYKFRV